MISLSITILSLLSLLNFTNAHLVISYPGWRGNNLHTNGTVQDTNGMIQGETPNGTVWPYGMQWEYPCGGMPTTTNRTKWPVLGGALAFQPGWFYGHSSAFIYINLGFGTNPPNMSNVMVPPFHLIGPDRNPYPGTFCLLSVPLPANTTVNIGDNATIQIIETAVHGAALYSCVDITFADPADCEEVTEDNCFNSSQISSDLIFTTSSLSSIASRTTSQNLGWAGIIGAVVLLGWSL